MPEIKRFNKGTLKKYMQAPADQWAPIESADDVHKGMVIRNPDEPENPAYYLYVTTDVPDKGHHLVRALDGTRESKITPGAFPKRFQQFIGPVKGGLPEKQESPKAPIPPPEKPDKDSADEKTEKMQELKKQMARRKGVQQSLVAPESTPEEREKREAKLAAEVEKRRKAEHKQQQDALKNLDHEKVAEEKKLLQAACLALAYAFGKDAPDACDTAYAEVINHMATDVVLNKVSHTDAVAAIVARIRADADAKAVTTAKSADQDKTTKAIDTRLTQVEKDIKSLDKQISRMTTHMESVLKRWEAISPFIPSNAIQYFETSKHKRPSAKGGNLGVISYQTGNVEKIPTDKNLDEIVETRVLSVKNGLCIHFNQSEAEAVHNSIASAMGLDPKQLWGYDPETQECYAEKSEEPGYTFVRCFDLTRSVTTNPYEAAGGRIKNPKMLVNILRKKHKDKVLVVVPEGAELA